MNQLLNNIMKEKNLSQEQLATSLGVSQPFISRLRSGQKKSMTILNLFSKLESKFGVPVETSFIAYHGKPKVKAGSKKKVAKQSKKVAKKTTKKVTKTVKKITKKTTKKAKRS